MKAMLLERIAEVAESGTPLRWADWPMPEPQPGEILIKVSVCGVCRTELDEIEGRTAPPRLPVIPGHQVIGRVVELGSNTTKWQRGNRVGVGWIHASTGEPDENLSPAFQATGRDVNGGYAEYMTVSERYAFPIPHVFEDREAAPLLCAGAVGYRALLKARIRFGDRLGFMGFGSSANLVMHMARFRYPGVRCYVFARDPETRSFALEQGACWAGDIADTAPDLLDAVVDTTPAWRSLVEALRNLKPGGRLIINAIRKEDADQISLLRLKYHEHLWMEREVLTVANVTGRDIQEALALAAQIPLRAHVTAYPLQDANRALSDLKWKPVKGSKVLIVS